MIDYRLVSISVFVQFVFFPIGDIKEVTMERESDNGPGDRYLPSLCFLQFVKTNSFSKICSVENLFRAIFIPLCSSPAPVGGGGACDASDLYKKIAALLSTGNIAPSQMGGCPTAGAKV